MANFLLIRAEDHVLLGDSWFGLVISGTDAGGMPVLETCDLPAGVSPDRIDLVSLDGAPGEGVPAWRPIPGHTVAGDQSAALPALALPAGSAPLRLRVREIERLDGVAAAAVPAELRERTVFVDVIAIPPAWLHP